MEGRRQTERSETTRAALLEVARTLFAERGFAATPTEEIVRRAGLTRGALYHHWRDKEELFRAVFEQIEVELTERSAHAVEGRPNMKEGLRAAFSEFLDACLEPDVQRIALIDGPAVLGSETVRAIEERYALGLVVGGLEAAMGEGAIARQPSQPLAQMLLGAVTEGAMLIARSDDVRATRAQVGQIVDRLLAGLEEPS